MTDVLIHKVCWFAVEWVMLYIIWFMIKISWQENFIQIFSKGTNKSRLGSIIARSGTTYSDKGGSIHDIVTLRWNSLYDENELIYDIGVFKVKQSFVYSQTLQPIKLPTTNSINLQAGTVYGWGYTVVIFIFFLKIYLFATIIDLNSEGNYVVCRIFFKLQPGSGKASDILRSITLPRVDNTACGKYYGKPNVSPTVICYGHPQGGNTTCQVKKSDTLYKSIWPLSQCYTYALLFCIINEIYDDVM